MLKLFQVEERNYSLYSDYRRKKLFFLMELMVKERTLKSLYFLYSKKEVHSALNASHFVFLCSVHNIDRNNFLPKK